VKFFKGRSKKMESIKQEAPEPRDVATVTKEYQQKVFQLGQVRYQQFVLEREAEGLNVEILRLNQEAAKRNALDKSTTEGESKDEKTAEG
jgi:hypothetical protein